MFLKGNQVKKSSTVVFRDSIKGKDKDYRLNDCESNYVSFVKISDCLCYMENNTIYYETDNAPAIPIVHGGTYYGYTPWKKVTSKEEQKIKTRDGNIYLSEWMECTKYFVYKGDVYSCKLRQPINEKRVNEDAEYLKNYKKYISFNYNKNTFYLNAYTKDMKNCNQLNYLKSYTCTDEDSVVKAVKDIISIVKSHETGYLYISDYKAMRHYYGYQPILKINKDEYELLVKHFKEEDVLSNMDYKKIAKIIFESI